MTASTSIRRELLRDLMKEPSGLDAYYFHERYSVLSVDAIDAIALTVTLEFPMLIDGRARERMLERRLVPSAAICLRASGTTGPGGGAVASRIDQG